MRADEIAKIAQLCHEVNQAKDYLFLGVVRAVESILLGRL
jgi:hypothetical protein